MRENKMNSDFHREETPASEDLLSWCKKITNEIYGLDVNDLTTSWKNGMAFCALIHHFRPDLIDYYKLNPEESKVNFKCAFDAIRKLGIPSIMSSGDLMILDVPDKLTVMTVLHQIRGYFNRKERKSKGLEWDCDDMFDDFDSDDENNSLFSIALDQKLADWPSKKVDNLESIMSYASPFLLDTDYNVNPNNQPTNSNLRSTKLSKSSSSTSKPTINSKPGEQFNGLNLPGSNERGKESVLSQSLRSVDFNSQPLESSSSSSSVITTCTQSTNTQQSSKTVQKEKKPLMTRKQLMDPFDSDSDEDKTPKGKISQRRASTSQVPTNGSTITDILDLATAEDSDPLIGMNLSSPTSPDSNPSSATTSSSSTTPSMSTSSSSYSNNLTDNISISCNQPPQTQTQPQSKPLPPQSQPIIKPTIIELAPGLLDVSPKKVSPFQRARTAPAYRSLRLDTSRKITSPDRRDKLHEKARQLIEETRKKKMTLEVTPTNLNPLPEDDRRRQLREKARQMLSDQISKMIKEKSPIEPRNMEAAIRDLTLQESRKISIQSTPTRISTIKSFNNNPSTTKSPKKSYVDMELMILEKEQSKIDKESSIIEEKLRLIMKNETIDILSANIVHVNI
ncbi:EH domain-binding protein 1-like isoform X2 [Panonychus citri]|uniref:EH domain-binding protein 1-like isoform X2 n=1 Tax=Panonychus citri TaxID=50023 RepID=UPI002306F3E1|nr:EH domain-binding protein 1-like isoform X2 [Panonychus citri]